MRSGATSEVEELLRVGFGKKGFDYDRREKPRRSAT